MSKTRQPHSAGVKQVCFLLVLMILSYSSAISQTSIFTSQIPVAGTDNDHKPTVAQEVGVKFISSAAGTITGIRFYKTSGNTGTHIGELYASNGTRLAQATFVNETATGWQTVSFTAPVAITANTSYTAAYFSSLGNYTEDNDYFKGHAVTNAPLTAPADGTNGGNGTDPGNGQGVYAYSAAPAFPNQLYRSANYWVDVIYSNALPVVKANAGKDTTLVADQFGTSFILNGSKSTGNITSFLWTLISAPDVTSPVIASPGSVTSSVSELYQGNYIFQLSVNGGASTAQIKVSVKPPLPYIGISQNQTIILPDNSTSLNAYDPYRSPTSIGSYLWKEVYGPNNATIDFPTEGLSTVHGLIEGLYLFQVAATGAGGTDTGYTKIYVLKNGLSPNIFTTQAPAEGITHNTQGIELGVRFRSTLPGYITGIRFYKKTGNTGTHTGELYSYNGTRLASAVFTNESASGWQTVTFNSPVAVLDNTDYIASYFSSTGNYTSTPNGLADGVINNPLTAYNSLSAAGSSPVFPTSDPNSNNADNYWVDVVYTNATPNVKADAGPDMTIYAGDTVKLDGSRSTGNITSYTWSLIFSEQGDYGTTISTPSAVSTTITGLTPTDNNFLSFDDTYIYQLSLNGGASVSRVTIHVLNTTSRAGSDQIIAAPASSVTLDGSKSTGKITSYLWAQTAGPVNAVIAAPSSVNTIVNGLVPGKYSFMLTVSGKFTSRINVTVTSNATQPVAFAGANQKITANINAYLDGSGSTGPITSYLWKQISGPDIGFQSATTQTVYLSYLPTGTYSFQLSVNGGVSTSTVTIQVNPVPAPVANAGSDQTIYLPNNTFILNSSNSTGNIQEINWTQISGPNTATIQNPSNAFGTTVSNLIAGIYIFQLAVADGVTDQMQLIVEPVPPPIANAGVNQTITLPVSSVTLDGSGSSGSIKGYVWSEISGPGVATIIIPNDVAPTVTGLVQGTYIFQLSMVGGATTSQVTVNVLPGSVATGKNIFTMQTPVNGTDNDHQPSVGFEAGLKFRSSVAGTITGVRFYKTNGNAGTHIGELYSSTGLRLAQATFTSETTTGWQTVSFSTAVAITANTTYVAAYFSSLGNYVEDNNYFTTAVVNNPLTALADGTDGGNAPFAYSGSPTFPNQNYLKANYWVDVVFVPGTSNPVANAGLNQTITLPASTVTLSGSSSTGTISSYTWTKVSGPNTPVISTPSSVSTTVTGLVQGTYVFQLSVNNGASTAQVTITVMPTLAPAVANAGSDQTITLPVSSVTLDGSKSTGNISSYTWSTMQSGAPVPVITSPNSVSTMITGLVEGTYIFQLALNGSESVSQVTITVLPQIYSGVHIFTTQLPSVSTDNDHQPTVGQEVGVKFSSSVAGYIFGIRFYKTSGNTGTHIGELYSSDGTRLAQATFTNESATGWQSVQFSTPVTIQANTTYTAAYFSSLGNYTEENNYFLNKAITNTPLTAPYDGTSGLSGTDPGYGQGVYKYTSAPSFPNQLYKSANYWVDVTFYSLNAITAAPVILENAKATDETPTDSVVKQNYFLGQNYPNPVPMSQTTKIEYSVPISTQVSLILYDMQGKPVKIMVNELKNAGRYSYDLNTGTLAKGLYIYSMHAGSFYDVKKLVVQ